MSKRRNKKKEAAAAVVNVLGLLDPIDHIEGLDKAVEKGMSRRMHELEEEVKKLKLLCSKLMLALGFYAGPLRRACGKCGNYEVYSGHPCKACGNTTTKYEVDDGVIAIEALKGVDWKIVVEASEIERLDKTPKK